MVSGYAANECVAGRHHAMTANATEIAVARGFSAARVRRPLDLAGIAKRSASVDSCSGSVCRSFSGNHGSHVASRSRSAGLLARHEMTYAYCSEPGDGARSLRPSSFGSRASERRVGRRRQRAHWISLLSLVRSLRESVRMRPLNATLRSLRASVTTMLKLWRCRKEMRMLVVRARNDRRRRDVQVRTHGPIADVRRGRLNDSLLIGIGERRCNAGDDDSSPLNPACTSFGSSRKGVDVFVVGIWKTSRPRYYIGKAVGVPASLPYG